MSAFEEAWQILKFYGKPYQPEGLRDAADQMRSMLENQQNEVREKREAAYYDAQGNPVNYDDRDYGKWKDMEDSQKLLGQMHDAYPDLKDRSTPESRDANRFFGFKPSRDPGDEDNVATKLARQEGVGAESSFQTEGMGESVMQPTPDWLAMAQQAQQAEMAQQAQPPQMMQQGQQQMY